MTEEEQQHVAVFRFGVIHDLVGSTRLDHGEQEELLQAKCARQWTIPGSRRTRLSRSTILRWVRLYTASGGKLEALAPRRRQDRGRGRVLDEDTALAVAELRRQMPRLPVPNLLRLLGERRLVPAGTIISLSTAYRLLHRLGLMTREQTPVDRRKFEAELPNDLWQSDVMHGPHLLQDGKLRKSYLIAFIDDHSRLVPHGQFYPSEAVGSFMEALAVALARRGLPRKLYVDNGSAFRSRQLEHTAATLGIAVIHARPYQPQGKGKIERFFKTVRTQFLPTFTGTTLAEINAAFTAWLDEYQSRLHSATGQSPLKRFTRQMHCLRPAPERLSDYFRSTVRRRVNKDRSVVVNRRLFEAPVALIGQRVEILYHEDQPEQVEIRYQGESHGLLRQVDLQVNSRVKRDKNGGVALTGDGHTTGGQLWEGA
jgi:putative transposase